MPKKNNSQEYWAKRRQQDKIKVIKEGEKGIDNLKRLLKTNLDDVQAKIKLFYEKYGENPAEKMSFSEWRKYKAKLKRMAQQNPQDEFLQRLAKQNIPKYQIDRLRALELDLQMQLTEATSGQAQGIYNTLDDVARVSQSVLAKSMQASIGLKFNSIADRKLKQLLSSDWSGANWSDRLWHDRAVVGKKVTEILQKGVTQGTSLQKMARELKQTTNQSFNNAFRLIRTETSHIDGQVTLEGYKQAGVELGLEYYEYDAFLDSRTSTLCRDLDKKRFKVSEAEVGINYPPMHPNCRSTTQLVLDEEYKQEETQENNQKEVELYTPIRQEHTQKEAKNIKEAKEYADRFVKNGKSTFDNNITLENLNQFNKQMTYLTQKYNYNEYTKVGSFVSNKAKKPNAHANLQMIEIEKTFGAKGLKDFEKLFAMTSTNYKKDCMKSIKSREDAISNWKSYLGLQGYDQRKIKKQIKMWQNEITELQEALKYKRGNAKSSAKNYFIDTINHEFGHSLLFRAVEKNPKIEQEVKDIYKKVQKNGDIYKISKYANKNYHEFFAECFSIYESGMEKLPKDVNNMIERVINN